MLSRGRKCLSSGSFLSPAQDPFGVKVKILFEVAGRIHRLGAAYNLDFTASDLRT